MILIGAIPAVLIVLSLIRVPAALVAKLDIGRPAGEVFHYLSDPRNVPTLSVPLGEVRNWDGPMRVGARWQVVVDRGNGRESVLDYSCVEFTQGLEIVSETRSHRMRSQVTTEVEPWGDCCQVTLRSIAMVPPLWSLVIHSPFERARMRDECERLKALLDAA